MKTNEKTNSSRFVTILLLSGLMMSATNVFSQETKTETDPPEVQKPEPIIWNTYWDKGFQFKSSDGRFKMKFGGRINYDFAFFFQSDTLEKAFGKINNGAEFRRTRFYHSGQIYNNIKYKIQFDFGGGLTAFKDVWINYGKIPVIGNIKVGHFKEPFRLEVITSGKYITFMERGTILAFTPERNAGFMAYNKALDSKLTWAFGFFRRADGFGNDKQADDGYAITTRVTGLPFYKKDEEKLVHLGAGYSYRKPDSKTYSSKTRAEDHLGHKYVNTGTISDVDVVTLFGVEAAAVFGPFSLQGEFVSAGVNTKTDTLNTDYSFSAYYIYASYFLTGESRPYSTSLGAFSRVSPKNNVGDGKKGLGAWEVGVRYSSINLIDGSTADNTLIAGGLLNDITIGVNWYLNPTTRIMVNYVIASLKNADVTDNDAVKDAGNAGIFQMRFHVDF